MSRGNLARGQNRLDGGDGELRVVGVLPARVALELRVASQEGIAIRNAVRPQPLKWGAQSVPDGAAEKAAQETVPERNSGARPLGS